MHGVRRGMGVLDGVIIVEGEGAAFGLILGRPIVTNGEFATRIFPNYFAQYLLEVVFNYTVVNNYYYLTSLQ